MGRSGGNGELALGVGADDFGTWGHVANVNEARRIRKWGANVALQTSHSISGWSGCFLSRGHSAVGKNGLSWSLDPVGTAARGEHGVRLRLGRGHAVLNEGDQAITLDLAPSVAWREATGRKGNSGEQTDDE